MRIEGLLYEDNKASEEYSGSPQITTIELDQI